MRRLLSTLASWLILAQFTSNAYGADNNVIAAQIAAIPSGSRIELHLKNDKMLKGTRGEISDSNFTLIDSHKHNRSIEFDDIVSVRQVNRTSHVKRNVLIGAGIGVAVVAILAAVAYVHFEKCGPLNCKSLGI